MSDDLDKLFIETNLRKMVSNGWFSISDIDSILKVTKSVPDQEIYKRLHLLHCVHFKDMPEPVLQALPDMIRKVIGGPPFDFDSFFKRKSEQQHGTNIIEITPEPQAKGLLARWKDRGRP